MKCNFNKIAHIAITKFTYEGKPRQNIVNKITILTNNKNGNVLLKNKK